MSIFQATERQNPMELGSFLREKGVREMVKTMVFAAIVILLVSSVAPAAIYQSQQTRVGHVAVTRTAGVYGVARQNNTSTAAADQTAVQVFPVAARSTQRSFSTINSQSYTQSFLGAATTYLFGYVTTSQQQLITP